MISTVGMVVTIVIIIAAAIGGVWYWTKIKEDKSSEPPKDNRHAEIQEPILRNDDALPKPISHIKIPSEEPKEEDAPAAEPPLETAEEEKKEESEVSALPAEQSEPSDNYLEQPQPEELSESGLFKHDPFLMELVRINFRKPVTGSQLTPFVRSALDEIAPHGLLRVLALESNSQRWFKPDAIGMFEAVAFYVQLASSHASFNDVSLNQLNGQIFQRMEMHLDGSCEIQDVQELVNRTQYLNALIKQFGVQITLLLRPIEKVSIDTFEREATLLGFKRRSSKHYEKIGELVTDKEGRRLGNRKGTIEIRWIDDSNITISLNVPLIAPEKDPLRLFMTAVNAFAAVFDAEIVGSNGKVIDGATISLLKQELDRFYKEMRAKDVEPGSLRAHRLLD